jgi:hypothetical protein
VLCKYYLFDHDTGYRSTHYLTGDAQTIDQTMMTHRLSGDLGGYQIYAYRDYEEYISDTSLNWSRKLTRSWFDRGAMVAADSRERTDKFGG